MPALFNGQEGAPSTPIMPEATPVVEATLIAEFGTRSPPAVTCAWQARTGEPFGNGAVRACDKAIVLLSPLTVAVVLAGIAPTLSLTLQLAPPLAEAQPVNGPSRRATEVAGSQSE
jgi:hypothetical protein